MAITFVFSAFILTLNQFDGVKKTTPPGFSFEGHALNATPPQADVKDGNGLGKTKRWLQTATEI